MIMRVLAHLQNFYKMHDKLTLAAQNQNIYFVHVFVCLLRVCRDFFTHMETPPLALKELSLPTFTTKLRSNRAYRLRHGGCRFVKDD